MWLCGHQCFCLSSVLFLLAFAASFLAPRVLFSISLLSYSLLRFADDTHTHTYSKMIVS